MRGSSNTGEFFVDVEHGKIVQMRLATHHFNLMKSVDGCYKISIQKGKKRTGKQNKYYWHIVVEMVYHGLRDMGFETILDRDDAHLVLTNMFLKQVEEKNGVKIEKGGSTRTLTRKEFIEYIEKITIWAWDYLGIIIPAPTSSNDAYGK